MLAFILWYDIVRDFEVIRYQVLLMFFMNHEPRQTNKTYMHSSMCVYLDVLS